MATVTPPPVRRTAPSPAVLHPLERLRGTIRRFVALEGLAVVGLYLALWFWLGLFFDFGVFKAFGFDWVQELPRGFRESREEWLPASEWAERALDLRSSLGQREQRALHILGDPKDRWHF